MAGEVIEATETTADAPPQAPVGATSRASRVEVQAAVRLLNAVVGGIEAAVEANGVRPAFVESWRKWRAGWDGFAAGVERPVWDLDAAAAQVEQHIAMVGNWRTGLRAEVGASPVGWLFEEMPVAAPTATRQRASEIIQVAADLDAPMQRIDNLGARGAWTAWYAALKRYKDKIDASWWAAVSGETAHTLGIFAEQTEDWRHRLARYEREADAAAKGPTPGQQAVGAPPKAGWPLWAKVFAGVGIVSGAYVGVRWIMSHWASGTPVRPELPMTSPEEKKQEVAA